MKKKEKLTENVVIDTIKNIGKKLTGKECEDIGNEKIYKIKLFDFDSNGKEYRRSLESGNRWLLKGCTFNNLTVIEESTIPNKHWKCYWLCKCVCGNYREVLSDCLIDGKTKSCKQCTKDKIRGINMKNRLPEGEASRNALFGKYKTGAK